MNEAGRTVVTWAREDVAQASIGTASGGLPAGTALSNPLLDAASPAVAVNAAGAIGVAWRRVVSGDDVIQARVRPAGAATFVAAQDLATAGDDAGATAAIDPAGRLTTAWCAPARSPRPAP